MAEINAKDVMRLREKTQAGMMDCKKALTESNGDFTAAEEWLKIKGLSAAAKKSSRTTAEGLIAVAVAGSKAVLVELNCETDFAGKNDKFQALVNDIANVALDKNVSDRDSLLKANYPNSALTVEDTIKENIAVIGENMNLRRVALLTPSDAVISSYMHNALTPNLGKIGVLVVLKTNAADKARVQDFGKKVAMHIAATRPESLTTDSLDATLVQKERAIFAEQARESGKPESIIEKMVDGRIRKFYEEVVLLEQVFVLDGKTRVKDAVAEFAKEIGSSVEIIDFVRYTLGEGIEKEETDFAAEVAATAKR